MAATRRVRADDDLLPADAVAVVPVAVRDPARPVEPRAGEQDLEPRRVEAPGTAWMCEARADRPERGRLPVDREARVLRDLAGVGAGVDAAGLVGGDLGQVEDVADVEARPRDLDAAEA